MSNSVIVKEWKKFRRYKDGAEYYCNNNYYFLLTFLSYKNTLIYKGGWYVKSRTSKGGHQKRKSS